MANRIDKILLLRLVVIIICFIVIGYIFFLFATEMEMLKADPCTLCEEKTDMDCSYPGEIKPFTYIPDGPKPSNFTLQGLT